jgi:hypothetical protein
MKRKRWEVKLRKELKEKLFQPRLERIVAHLKGDHPKRIGGRDKRDINKSIKRLIPQALRPKYRTELNSLKPSPKSFNLRIYPPNQRKVKIIQKIKKYEEDRGKRVRRLVYTLWNDGRECLYVGQTKRGLPEIVAKAGKLYKESARLKLFFTDKKKLDRHEGIAYHVLAPRKMSNPKFNRSHPKNAQKCPFCQTESRIKKEIDRALVLAKPKRASA